MMTNSEFENLVKDYLENKLSPEQERQLIVLLTTNPSADLLAKFDSFYLQYSKEVSLEKNKKDKIWSNIHSHLVQENSYQTDTRKNNRWKSFLPYAAIFIGMISLATLLFTLTDKNNDETPPNNTTVSQIFLKKHSGLIYATNSTNGNNIPLQQSDFKTYGIVKDSAGTLVFRQDDKQVLAYNTKLTIQTQKGQTQALVLPDGSKVWINSNSQITFPRSFNAKERQVQLVGEGYFEVTHLDRQPFSVQGLHYTTEVLGTHFNIQSYPNSIERISLLEGKVKVSSLKTVIHLSPGQQAYGETTTPKKTDIDTTDILAWQQGYFKFENADIYQLTEQIRDWYDVKFIKINSQSGDRFSGTYRRTNDLNDLLKNLEEVSNLKFNIKEGGIYVTNK
ncbi:MAG: FecR domain-containing protein [Sphingobacterium sp.]|jgi:ferric-dicitrate binding protein FerR (iron transport regulator)|uniref:FecR family protein n=1 Tax=Sphingobacterium sp. TaxID=341027 RepID=UPI00284EBD07|nr:FecR domain-containing protein [Sphingobacterium sp.]MDR3009543.1 FecR domain-containing protein [Sphingobacterium sp.]